MLFKKKKNQEISKVETKKDKIKNNKNKVKVPKTVQQTIPYLYVYEDNGIIETEPGVFTKSYQIDDVNYQMAKEIDQESMFLKYGEFLNSFGPEVKLQININVKTINKDDFERYALIPERGDELDKIRREVNNILIQKLDKGRSNTENKKYLTVSIKEDSVEAAEKTFNRLDEQIRNNIRKIGSSDAKVKSTEERLEILNNIFHTGEEVSLLKKINRRGKKIEKFNFKEMKKQGLSTKDIIGPDSFTFKYNYMKIGDTYARALYLKSIPNILGDNFLSQLTDVNFNMLTSLNIEPIEPEVAVKMVKNKNRNLNAALSERQKKAAREGYSPLTVSNDLSKAIDENDELLESLTSRNQKMFFLTMTIVHFAESLEQLDHDSEIIYTTARGSVCEFRPLNYQQELGLTSTLPLANNKLQIKRTLTTEALSVFMPFVSQEYLQRGGIFYGINIITKFLIIINRLLAQNFNGFIFGKPGSGKSFAAKWEMILARLCTNDDIIIIDPEGEYAEIARMLNGVVIDISTNSNTHINPMHMDINYSEDDNPISFKSDFMIQFIETIFGERVELSGYQRSIIDRCCTMVYKEYLSSVDPNTGKPDITKMPTLVDLQRILEAESGLPAMEIAGNLQMYSTGNLNLFAHQTNVEYNNRFVVYNIKDLGPNMKKLGLLVVLDNIWNRMMQNFKKGKNTRIYIDEAHLLFRSKGTSEFVNDLFKRARKFGGIPTAITQNVTDVLKNHVVREMIQNSEFVQMLNLSAIDRNELAELLNISDTQLLYITDGAPGEGLIYTGSTIIPFKNEIPEDSLIYKTITTKLADKSKYKLANRN